MPGGRPKGSKGKKKQEFREALRKYAEDHGVDPHYWMVDLLKRKGVKLELKFQAAKELAQYLEAKLRAVEVTGEDGGPIQIGIEMVKYADDEDTDTS